MEHMYQLALTAWYLLEKDGLKFDKQKVVCMALVHDIVEAYTGDIPTYSPKHNHPSREENERLAAEKLKREWPEFGSLHALIEEYEKRESPEAKFVYALDKLMPMLNNYIYGGRIWKKIGLDLDWLKSSKAGKIDVSPEIYDYYQQMLELLNKHPELFGRKKAAK
jgi:putative hydrolases of HD superfamily